MALLGCSLSLLAKASQEIRINDALHGCAINSNSLMGSNCTVRCFEVNINEAGAYYAEFWLLPSMYDDGSYTEFKVYVNDEFIGTINPNKGNWQSAKIKESDTVFFEKGCNRIIITVLGPEIPMVESVKISKNDRTSFLSSSYDDFYKKAMEGTSFVIPTEDYSVLFSANKSSFPIKHFENVPLKYTFYTKMNLAKGNTIWISSKSLSQHDVDVIYLGTIMSASRNECLSSPILDSGNLASIQDFGPSIKLKNLAMTPTVPADSIEMQGLNWKGLSHKQFNSSINRISKHIVIPKSGIYLIRLRHRESGKMGIADMTIKVNNKTYEYNAVPISFSWVPCEIPANGNQYGTMTICSDKKNDDPMLFIHGAAADRIVGYSDDTPWKYGIIHELSDFDSHVFLSFNVKTSGISVCNYSSSDPESTCEILAGIDESLFSLPPEYDDDSIGDEIEEIPLLRLLPASVAIDGTLDKSGVLTISYDNQIENVTISDMSGNIIKKLIVNASSLSIPRETLSIIDAGIHIVSVKTDRGLVSRKVLIE